LLDIDLPDINGIDALERIKAHAPQIRVVMISGMKNEPYLQRALRDRGPTGVARTASSHIG